MAAPSRGSWAPKVLPAETSTGAGDERQATSRRSAALREQEHEMILFTPEEVAPPRSFRPRGVGSAAAARAKLAEDAEPGADKPEGRPSQHGELAARKAASAASEARADSTAKMRLRLVLRKYERQWAQLSDGQRDAASELGWGADTWDMGDLKPCRDSRWRYLAQRQREAAEALLFCGRTWELAGAEADLKEKERKARRASNVAKLVATPVSTWALGMPKNMTLDELYATAGRVIGFRNMPNVKPAEILHVMRPLLTGHRQDTYELRSAFRAFDRDGDGVVTPTELRQALFDLGIELNTQQILDLLSTMGGSAMDTAVDYVRFARLLAPKRKTQLHQTVAHVSSILQSYHIDLGRAFRGFVQGDGYLLRGSHIRPTECWVHFMT